MFEPFANPLVRLEYLLVSAGPGSKLFILLEKRTMKRKMLFFERFMYIDGVTPINCTLTARVRGPIPAGNLRTALNKVQAKHPLLRARILQEEGEPYFVWDDAIPEIPVQVIERQSDEDWNSITVAQWNVPFETQTGPLLRVLWIKSDEVSELMVVGHHCICDGGSVITLLREILLVLDQPETELVPYTGYSSLVDLIPQEVLSDAKTIRRTKRKAMIYKLFLALWPARKPVYGAGDPYVLYWKSGVELLEKLNARCTAEETSLFAALCVAFLMAFEEVKGKGFRNKIMCPVNIRRSIRAVKSDMMFAFAPTIQLSLDRKSKADFWTRTRAMKKKITSGIEGMKVYEDMMVADLMRDSVPQIVRFLRSSRGGHDIAFSNVGRLKVETTYRTFALEALIGGTVAVPWKNTNTLMCTQFLQEMELGFISNERFLPRKEALAIRERALQLLAEAMEQPVRTVEPNQPVPAIAEV
jgi:NRPS condensation-like uncharacterized protein